MTVWRRSPLYPLCLLVGALLFGSAGLAHPLLTGDGATQLAIIAGTPAWRAIHWALLFGLPLMFVGLIGLGLRHAGTPGEVAARAGVFLATLGFGGWMVNVLFMVGGGGVHRVLPQHVLRPGARRRVVRRGGSADAPGGPDRPVVSEGRLELAAPDSSPQGWARPTLS